MASRVSIGLFFFVSSLLLSVFAEEGEYVLTLDHSNITETVSKHELIVVEFYAPWCGHCKKLAPEYEKAASVLRSHDPPVVLAKVDLDNEANRELATKYEIQGFPTLKIFRNGGKGIQEYNGPREADGIVAYLKKQAGPASVEIKSAEDVSRVFDEKKIFIVGVFPKFSGEEYENFQAIAEKLRSDYDFGHTLDAKLLPRGGSVTGPTIRLLKPFDELFIDFQEFEADAVEKFFEQATVPIVTVYDNDPNNQPFIIKYFNTPSSKAMLFVNFSSENVDAFKSKFKDIATAYKGKGLSFLVGDLDTSGRVLQYYGLKADQAPLTFINNNDGKKYQKTNLKPDHIVPWFKEYEAGSLEPFVKSEPIPEDNDEPVKVVVAHTVQDIVFNSGKNVLLEFYAPWCGHCKKLASILEEVAESFENDPDVIIAKLDATANDFPQDTFEVKGFPTVYFRSASGKLSAYDGDRTKEDIIGFIEMNRDGESQSSSAESAKPSSAESAPVKDEL